MVVYLVDQMQYLAWIRDASHHLLASNLFVLRNTPADYFQPAIVISGGLSALGVAAVAVTAAVEAGGGARRSSSPCAHYAHRSLERAVAAPRGALTLALFFGSFTIIYGSVSVIGDMFPGFLSWGYVFGLIALAAMVGALLCYDARASGGAGRVGAWAARRIRELVASLARRAADRDRRRRGAAAGHQAPDDPTADRAARCSPSVLTALPLLYYVLLGRTDLSWALARDASKHAFSFWSIALAIAAARAAGDARPTAAAHELPRGCHTLMADRGGGRVRPVGHRGSARRRCTHFRASRFRWRCWRSKGV